MQETKWVLVFCFADQEKKNQILSGECMNILDLVVAHTESLRLAIQSGDILIDTLEYIHENCEVFSDIAQMINSGISQMKATTLKFVQQRMREKKEFEKQAGEMTLFVDLCQHLKSGRNLLSFKSLKVLCASLEKVFFSLHQSCIFMH